MNLKTAVLVLRLYFSLVKWCSLAACLPLGTALFLHNHQLLFSNAEHFRRHIQSSVLVNLKECHPRCVYQNYNRSMIREMAVKTQLYRVSQEERAKLREGVAYVKLYLYNPKHLYPKLNGYGDNGQKKVWTSCISAYCTSTAGQRSLKL